MINDDEWWCDVFFKDIEIPLDKLKSIEQMCEADGNQYFFKHLYKLMKYQSHTIGFKKEDGQWYITGIGWKEKFKKELNKKREVKKIE